jgi:hypothetical protein
MNFLFTLNLNPAASINGDVFASADVGYGRAYALDIVEA